MIFELSLIRKGVISSDAFVRALEWQLEQRQPIGRLCLEQKRLTMNQLFQILAAGADRKMPFGEIAVELGYLTREDIAELLLLQSEKTPTLSDALVHAGDVDSVTLDRELRLFRLLAVDESSHTMVRSDGGRTCATA